MPNNKTKSKQRAQRKRKAHRDSLRWSAKSKSASNQRHMQDSYNPVKKPAP